MDLVTSKEEILENIATIDGYLADRVDPEHNYALDLIKRGWNFVALADGDTTTFYPSRFIGYVGNTMDSHDANDDKHGGITTPRISKITNSGNKPAFDPSSEQKFLEYCNLLGIVPDNKNRKYWLLDRACPISANLRRSIRLAAFVGAGSSRPGDTTVDLLSVLMG